MTTNTPLRYPGGKSRITPFIKSIIQDNNLVHGNYVEPFAGGCGVALNLLFDGTASHIYINDKDRSIYAFWHSILSETERFKKAIQNTPITIEEWKKQKELQQHKDSADLFNLGFSTFFLNRTNRSGIIKGGAIGGQKQDGVWKLNARFNKESLIDKIDNIAAFRSNIHLFNLDAVDFIEQHVAKLDPKNTLVYLDPPYYVKGSQLYMNYFNHEDHVRIYNAISLIEHKWLVSYDNQKEIKEIYNGVNNITYLLRYTAGVKHDGLEVIFSSNNILLSEDLNALLKKLGSNTTSKTLSK